MEINLDQRSLGKFTVEILPVLPAPKEEIEVLSPS